jgi:hypothetical protein
MSNFQFHAASVPRSGSGLLLGGDTRRALSIHPSIWQEIISVFFQSGKSLRTVLLGKLPADYGDTISAIFREYCDKSSLLPTTRHAIWATVGRVHGTELAKTVTALNLGYSTDNSPV